MTPPKIHPSADVQSNRIGDGTTIWQSTVVLPGARIGKDVNICAQCFVENDVEIDDRVTIKNGVQIWDGLRIGKDVFVGPNVTFTNDKFPRSKQYPEKFLLTRVGDRASIGGGAVILPGLTIGEGAMIGAGAVVTRSVPPFAIVVGSPARIIGYVEGGASQRSLSAEQRSFGPDIGATRLGIGNVSLHRLKCVEDMRGSLSVGEFLNDVPFTPKRYFLVYDVPSIETRGEHAHRQCHQFLVCVRGSCAVVIDDGKRRSEVLLDGPGKGIYLPPMIWGTQYKYSSDAVLIVFASEYYDAADYIRDYSEFVRVVQTSGGAGG